MPVRWAALTPAHRLTPRGPSRNAGFRSPLWPSLPGSLSISTLRRQSGKTMAMNSQEALVVDDAQDGAKLLVRMLQVLGLDAVQAHTGHEALAHLTSRTPAIIFLDIMLPDIDGCELARRIRALPRHAGARLYAVTGFDRLAEPALFDGFMQKPVTIARLRDLLEADARGDVSSLPNAAASPRDTL